MTVLAVLASASVFAVPCLGADSIYRFDEDRVPVGWVLHYLKSASDGSREGHVSIYVAAADRIESLKWEPGEERSTLVVALMDWSRFSARRFEAWSLLKGAAPEQRATLCVEGDQLRMSLMPEPITLNHWPWHSYDFDFTSLTITLPHRVDHRRDLRFWRTDFVYSDPPVVAELGEVTLRFVGKEKHDGVATWRYTLGGPGLESQTGDWWVDARTGLTVEYQLPIGDEPGYGDVRLKLVKRERLTAKQWEAFKASPSD